jgi:putative ABC transport system substrate-binding protein
MRLVLWPLTHLVALGLILCAPVEVPAQESGRVYRVGHISMMTSNGMAPYLATLEEALRDLGYVKGRNLVIENRSANGDAALLGAAASDLVRLNVDVIVTGTTQGVVAVRQVTTTVPIVMVYGIDPVGAGFIQSLAHPGGNVTGGAFEPDPAIYGKMVELLKETVPKLERVAFLWNPSFPGATTCMEATRKAAERLGVRFQSVEVRTAGEIETGFNAIYRERADGLIVVGDPLIFPARAQIVQLAARRRIPVVGPWREYVEAGALLSYGMYSLDRWKRAAVYIDKVLKGAKPGELPVEQPNTFELWVNLKTAKAFGIAVPRSIVQRADRILE